MINPKNIYFSRKNENAEVILHINDVTKYGKKHLNKSIYILDIDMYLQKEHNDKNKYIDEEIKSSMKMLFIGADTN